MKSVDERFEYQDKDGNSLPDGSDLSQVGRFQYECRSQWHGGLSEGRVGHCSINIANAGYDNPQHNWALSGSIDRPSIAPSVNCHDCWHGFIEGGIFLTTEKNPEVKQ